MTNLTTVQQGLVNGLIKEFTKINPKPSIDGIKRFSFDTINECKQEEEIFLLSVKKHNETMINVFNKQFIDESKSFNKEFGKEFTLQTGYTYNGVDFFNTHEQFLEKNKVSVKNNHSYNEIHLFIASKRKIFNCSTRIDRCYGKEYTLLYVDFKREKVTIKLVSGKEVFAWKIVGLLFSEKPSSERDKGLVTSTFDEFIQQSKKIQSKLVEMSE